MNYEDYQKHRWIAIYGASIAIQCHKYLDDLDDDKKSLDSVMPKIKEQAEKIANLALKGESP